MFNKKIEDDSEHSFWISYADMLTGFLISFMVIALLLASQVKPCPPCPPPCQGFGTVKPLFEEFERDMQDWEAVTIADSATLRFNQTSYGFLFDVGIDTPTPYFQRTLEDFSPTFNRVMYELLMGKKYDIKEIRFEGHTDSDGLSYFENLHLSARRASKVQELLIKMADTSNFTGHGYYKPYNTDSLRIFKNKLFNLSVSCGYSYSKRLGYDGKIIPICPDFALNDNPCKESYSPEKSRRIEIRIIGQDKPKNK
jgi:hypothetical protein